MIKVTIIVPCRNESDFIAECLDSIIANDFPKDNIELLVVDGVSDDNTREIIQKYCSVYPFMRLLDNNKRIQSAALNMGIKEAKGEIIMRIDAHSTYAKDYISKCVKYLKEYGADNVGGVCVTLPSKNNLLAQSIAAGLAHPFGVGNSYFRIGSKEPKFVDTVPFGCFKRAVFDKVGLFDEELVRNQDDEFNLRIIKNGGKILLAPDITSNYYARDSISKLSRMYYQYGYFKPLVVQKVGAVLTIRQLIPAIFISMLVTSGILSIYFNAFIWPFIVTAGLYIIANLYFSSSVASKKGLMFFLSMPLVFATLHFSYGTGYLKGISDFYFFRKKMKTAVRNVPVTR